MTSSKSTYAPVYHRKITHVQLCWLSLLLIRTCEITVANP